MVSVILVGRSFHGMATASSSAADLSVVVFCSLVPGGCCLVCSVSSPSSGTGSRQDGLTGAEGKLCLTHHRTRDREAEL